MEVHRLCEPKSAVQPRNQYSALLCNASYGVIRSLRRKEEVGGGGKLGSWISLRIHRSSVRRLFLGLHIYQIQSSPPFVSLFTPPPGIDGTGRCESERLKQLQNETQFDSIAKDGMCNK